jgi:hypothetical protein
MAGKTSKLKDQIAKGILSGMGNMGEAEGKSVLPVDTTESVSDIPAMTEEAPGIPGLNKAQDTNDRAVSLIEEPSSSASRKHTEPVVVLPVPTQPVSAIPTNTESFSVGAGLTDDDLLILMNAYLNREIHVKDRLWTGAGAKGLNKLKKVEGKIPEELVDEIRRLKGPVTHHLERAVRLYLAVLKA